MKKIMVSLAAALLCLCLAVSALGEASLRQVNQFTVNGSADFVSETNLLSVGDYNGRALATLDGTVLTEYLYKSFRYENGYITASLADGQWCDGVLTMDGQVVVPFEYGDIRPLSDVWVAAVRISIGGTEDDHDYNIYGNTASKYGRIDTVDLYNVREGKLMATLTRAEYLQAKASGEYLNVYNRTTETVTQYDGAFQPLGTVKYIYSFPEEVTPGYSFFYVDGKCGMKDAEGNVVLQAQYETIYDVRYGLVRFRNDGKYGLADLNGNILVPAEYDGFESAVGYYPAEYTDTPYALFGYAAVKLDEKVGYFSLEKGELTAEPLYGYADKAYNYGISQLRSTDDNMYYIRAEDGAETKLEGIRYCNHLNFSLGRYYVVAPQDVYKYGLVDRHGKEVLPCVYDAISMGFDGRSLITYDGDTGTVTVYELTDEFVAAD